MARSMKTTLVTLSLLAVMLVNCAFAHTYLSSIIVNDQPLSEGDCMRPHPDQMKEYPLSAVSDQDMTCGWLPAASRPANRKCPIAAGSKIGLQWYHTNPIPSDFILEGTHKGPVIVYLARSETGAGNVWFKVYEDGFDPITRKWATDKLIENRGRVDFYLPADIAPGNYLIRGEVLALHNAYDMYGIQPYVGCAELTISGSGSATPQGVAFPGAYVQGGTGMMLDLYKYYNSYTIPGPAIYRASSTPSTAAPTAAPTAAATTRPTTPPTAAPTTRPTTQPTQAPAQPTQAPAQPTQAPAQPTQAPAQPTRGPAQGNIKIRLNQGSNAWWVGLVISDAKETIAKVDIMDGVALTSWAPLNDLTYAWVFSQSVQIATPLSVRITSTSGKQINLPSIITSFGSSSVIDTGYNF